jgi:hypothetical protein
MTEPKINLLIPKLNKEQAYGGISTLISCTNQEKPLNGE